MRQIWLLIGVGLVWLAGCSTVPSPAQLPWRDAEFGTDPNAVRVGKDELFCLDPALSAQLRADAARLRSGEARADRLKSVLFEAGTGFAYRTHSTKAAQTWRERAGDCLSLTILAYALARELGVDAQMQEVRVPTVLDRRGEVDFLSRHVNVLVRIDETHARTWPPRVLVLDFEPAVGSFRAGTPLSDNAILSRYHNNRAVEHYTQGRDALAYAHFRAAIEADPDFATSYANLAQLYLRHGYTADAERLLRHAVALTGEADLALWSLHRLLVAQGRTDEAGEVEALLAERRDRDPYHWLGLGVEKLHAEAPREAVVALERARALSERFPEVHRHLALAYWRSGAPERARAELSILARIDAHDPGLAVLKRKLAIDPR